MVRKLGGPEDKCVIFQERKGGIKLNLHDIKLYIVSHRALQIALL